MHNFINIEWVRELHNGIKSDMAVSNSYPDLLISDDPTWYASSYVCPFCDDSMVLYKIKTRTAKSIFNGRVVNLFNVFTCARCQRFFGSLDDNNPNPMSTSRPLSQYALVSKQYDKNSWANLIIEVRGHMKSSYN